MSLATNPRISANSMLAAEGHWRLLLGPECDLVVGVDRGSYAVSIAALRVF